MRAGGLLSDARATRALEASAPYLRSGAIDEGVLHTIKKVDAFLARGPPTWSEWLASFVSNDFVLFFYSGFSFTGYWCWQLNAVNKLLVTGSLCFRGEIEDAASTRPRRASSRPSRNLGMPPRARRRRRRAAPSVWRTLRRRPRLWGAATFLRAVFEPVDAGERDVPDLPGARQRRTTARRQHP